MVSETLIGVFLGGVLTGFPAWIQLYQQGRQWQLEKRIEHARGSIERLTKMYKSASSAMIHSENVPGFEVTSAAEVAVYGSAEARDIYQKFFEKPPRDRQLINRARQEFETAGNRHVRDLRCRLEKLLE